jgi:acyl-CoA reductase-like NAD-dependent aldehyde dehydrogenase
VQEAVDALSRDDLAGVIRSLGRVRKKGRSRLGELVRQQAVFRCRLLLERHERELARLRVLHAGARCLADMDGDRVQEVMDLHRRALRILARYEASLQRLAPSRPSFGANPPQSDGPPHKAVAGWLANIIRFKSSHRGWWRPLQL